MGSCRYAQPANPFPKEIRDAIDRAGRVLLVVGPDAMASEYVAAEWGYALSACLGVLPVLRKGDYDLLPAGIEKLHCVNMLASRPYEAALDELLKKLQDRVPRPGVPRGVPLLPAHFQPRPEHLAALAASLLADVERPVVVTPRKGTAVLQGMGGIGKSVLAAAFARDCTVRRAFTDGIVWLAVGRHPSLLSALRAVGLSFDPDPESKPEYYADERARRRGWRRCLTTRSG